jgi:hypothetical protein
MVWCKDMPKSPNSNHKLIVKLSEEQQAAIAQASQISKISAESLARIALNALCRHIERQVRLTAPLEIISTRELEGFQQTFTALARGDARFTVGTKTRKIDPVTAALLT